MKFDDIGGTGGNPAAAGPPLRIAFLSYRSDPNVGGQGIFVRNVSAALARRGHRVTVISGPPYPDLPPEVSLTPLPSLDLFAQPYLGRLALRPKHFGSWTDLREFFGHHSGKFMEPSTFGARAARYLRANRDNFDVVLDNQCLADGLIDIADAGLPVLEIIHHPIHRDRDAALSAERRFSRRMLIRRWYGFLPMQERVAARLDRIVTVSESAARDIVRDLGAKEEAIEVVHPGFDRSNFRPKPDIERLPLRICSTASADVPLKGLPYLLEAFARVLENIPQAELVLVGRLRAGPTTDLLDRLGIANRISFRHGLSTEELASLYCSSALYVAPSLYEGFGLPVAEAMGCGTPVLVTDGGALPEIAGDAGRVVPRANSEALSVAIIDLLSSPDKRTAMSARGLARASSVFSWDGLAERYERIMIGAMATVC